MLSIDDAGWGCPALGVCIAVVREETGLSYVGRIAVRHFQAQFGKKFYLEEGWAIVDRALAFLKVDGKEKIVVCSGYVLSSVAKRLKQRGFNVEVRSKTDLKAHDVAEKAFREWLREVGAPTVELDRRGVSFMALTKWLFEDEERAKHLGKTGWKSWDKWRKYWKKRRVE